MSQQQSKTIGRDEKEEKEAPRTCPILSGCSSDIFWDGTGAKITKETIYGGIIYFLNQSNSLPTQNGVGDQFFVSIALQAV